MSSKRKITDTFILISLFIYSAIYKIVATQDFKFKEILTIIFLIIIAGTSIIGFGYVKARCTPFIKKYLKIVIKYMLFFVAVLYLLGMLTGFKHINYDLNTLYTIITLIISIIVLELIRYNFIRSIRDNFFLLAMITCAISILEIIIVVKPNSMYNFETTFRVGTSIIIPVIAKNILFSYSDYHIGYYVTGIYRCVFDIIIPILPITPELTDYFLSMIGIIMPSMIIVNISRNYSDYEIGEIVEQSNSKFDFFNVPIACFAVILIVLISRAFPLYLMGIGSGSMTGAINKGDAILTYKEKNIDKINVGDVIVFDTRKKTLVHRVVEIEVIDGIKYYRTKGDANNTRDNIDIKFEDIKGKVLYRIPYIARPSVWLTELMHGER